MTSLILATLGASLAGLGLLIVRSRHAQVRGADAIRIVTSKHLGAKRFLTIVEADGERLLLGLAGDNVTLLAHLDGGAFEYGEGGGESRRRPSEHGAEGAARTGAADLRVGDR